MWLDQLSSKDCHWAVNVLTLIAAIICIVKLHDNFLVAFFGWTAGVNLSEGLDKIFEALIERENRNTRKLI